MTPISPLTPRRIPEDVRRQLDVAAAAAWEALVEIHASHALRFVSLMSAHLDFDQAVDRYLDELDVRDPMAAAVRSRVLVALEHALDERDDRPSLAAFRSDDDDGLEGLKRFRPDVLMKGLARKVREIEALDQWVALAVARAEEGVIKGHVDNAVVFAALLRGHLQLDEAVDTYLELMRVAGGRAQSVFQRAMARLAELHLPGGPAPPRDGRGGSPG
ncbi:MAG: hypothetical protein GWM90_18750 [Gemmatimonadetes bacterium]|nr:hypothetical protein [Gemmatimonadota bacterium]NIQ56418.1 hypothetical protein [Gemmatimonadota bacterium]NIU76607.1 hypothetical protein [Gammaproteobacteria bacterium]NIX46054.1 hypothetical protein [Gemmatimonadota bacterium]NIY10375.1 hypothetical protein [Gemmatimonadota bacterium]